MSKLQNSSSNACWIEVGTFETLKGMFVDANHRVCNAPPACSAAYTAATLAKGKIFMRYFEYLFLSLLPASIYVGIGINLVVGVILTNSLHDSNQGLFNARKPINSAKTGCDLCSTQGKLYTKRHLGAVFKNLLGYPLYLCRSATKMRPTHLPSQ